MSWWSWLGIREEYTMTRWREFEEVADLFLRQQFPDHKIATQKYSTSTGRRPDFFLLPRFDRRSRIVADAKWYTEAALWHVDQVVSYKGYPFFAQQGILIYPENAVIPQKVEEYAKERNVVILKVPGVNKEKEREPGIKGLIRPKVYLR